MEVERARQRSRPSKTCKEVVDNDLRLKLSDTKVVFGNGVSDAVTVMPRDEYALYVSGARSTQLT